MSCCILSRSSPLFFLLLIVTTPTEPYTLSLHDALPISQKSSPIFWAFQRPARRSPLKWNVSLRLCSNVLRLLRRSEEHTSELQSLRHLVFLLLLEKKKTLIFPINSRLTRLCAKRLLILK